LIGRRRRRHRRRALAAAPLHAPDAAHVLGDGRIADVFDDARAGDARVERVRCVDEHVADPADRHRRVVREQVLGAIGARTRDRHVLLLDASGEFRIERARSVDAQRFGAKVVDRKPRAAGRGDSQRRRFELRHVDPHVSGERDDVEPAKAQRDVCDGGRSPAEETVPPAPAIERADEQSTVGDLGADAVGAGRLDLDRFFVGLQQRHLGLAADLDFVERRQTFPPLGPHGRLARHPARQRPPGERRRDEDCRENQPRQRCSRHRAVNVSRKGARRDACDRSLMRARLDAATCRRGFAIDNRGIAEYGIPNSVATVQERRRTVMEPASQPIRVVIAKVGLDGHDRGVKIVARTLRDAGMDVIYTGLHRTPEEVVEAAIQEDVDVIGVSILSGAHMTVFPRLIDLLRERDAEDILVVGGGVIPDEDLPKLKAIGVRELLLQDTPPREIVETIRRVVAERGPR